MARQESSRFRKDQQVTDPSTTKSPQVEDADRRIDLAIAAGEITQERADKVKSPAKRVALANVLDKRVVADNKLTFLAKAGLIETSDFAELSGSEKVKLANSHEQNIKDLMSAQHYLPRMKKAGIVSEDTYDPKTTSAKDQIDLFKANLDKFKEFDQAQQVLAVAMRKGVVKLSHGDLKGMSPDAIIALAKEHEGKGYEVEATAFDSAVSITENWIKISMQNMNIPHFGAQLVMPDLLEKLGEQFGSLSDEES